MCEMAIDIGVVLCALQTDFCVACKQKQLIRTALSLVVNSTGTETYGCITSFKILYATPFYSGVSVVSCTMPLSYHYWYCYLSQCYCYTARRKALVKNKNSGKRKRRNK